MGQKKTVWKSRLRSLGLCFVFLISAFAYPQRVKADVVTDTLSVCVGYYGMDLTEYVTVGTYHWSELEQNLPIYEEAYSYYSGGTFAHAYTAVVDAAHGFLVSDLLSYANVYFGDIYNILFYVEDAQGIWTAFDRDSLFCTRYYFDDLAGHRRILYGTREQEVLVGEEPITELQPVIDEETGQPLLDESGEPVMEEVITGYTPIYETRTVTDYTKIEGYDFEEAWDYSQPVEPMLAIEDNWAAFNETFEHIGPDFSCMSTGSRFRLLFGQLYPTESMTRDSAKYVSRVYVTLSGKPHIGEMPDAVDASLGSHEITVEIADVYNSDMVDALEEYLQLSSTNEEVLQIDGFQIEGTGYSDVAIVTIQYSVIGEGTASISLGIGGTALTDSNGMTLSDATRIDTSASGGSGGDTPEDGEPENSGSSEPDSGVDSGDNNAQEPSGGNNGEPENGGASEPNSGSDSDDDNMKEPAGGNSDAPGDAGQNNQTEPQGDESRDAGDNPAKEPPASDAAEPEAETLQVHEDYDTLDINEAEELPETDDPSEENTSEVLTLSGGPSVFALNGEALEQLQKPSGLSLETSMPDQSVTEVRIQDNTEEKANEERQMLIFTGIGLLAVGMLGAGSELLSFRNGIRKRRI